MNVLVACEESQAVSKRAVGFADCSSLPQAERSRARSKTFPGIAKAMAEQWG